LGIKRSLVRIPSWERANLGPYEKFLDILSRNNIECSAALLQQREDVLNPSHWEDFLEDVFSRFKKRCSFFEVGHAWNRTKWGVWDYREYLKLAKAALQLAQEHRVKLIGPAVIDFEFHLYPPLIHKVPFDKVSSLLYVDRQGAPEKAQSGWTTAKKVALLKAVIDACTIKGQGCWITEVNWPLKGTGKFSPAAGKPNVTEDEQSNYLVRYFVICLASGLVERIYWWQLVAPGYGLIDPRQSEWRRRSSFYALKTLVKYLAKSTFIEKVKDSKAEIYVFTKDKDKERFALCWSAGEPTSHSFPHGISKVLNKEGKEITILPSTIKIEESPIYVFFK
jgi:hypothetical protein